MKSSRLCSVFFISVFSLALPMQVTFAADAPATLKVGGFVDAQAYFKNDSALSEGFTLNDGAIYLTKEFGAAEAKIDLPFRGNAGTTTGADFSVGATKAQAYVAYTTSNGIKFKLGQFDTIYGFELNDAPDLAFSRQGIVYSAAIPVVHAGLLATYEIAKALTLNLLAANPHDQGQLRGGKLDFGAQALFNPGNFRFTAGTLQGKSGEETTSLWDFLAGATFGKLALDLELAIAKKAAFTQAGTALLGQALYTVTDTVTAGFRLESTNKLTPPQAEGNTLDDKQMSFTVGPQFALTQDLKAKVDYTYSTDQQGPGDAVKSHAYAVAGVFKF